MEKVIADIFKSAKKRGLKDISIKISISEDPKDFNCVLYVGGKDLFDHKTLNLLLKSLSEHEDLSWMNE